MKNKLYLIIILLLPVILISGEIKKIELKHLDGEWEGVGAFLLPITHTSVGIAGEAAFVWNDSTQRLRTSLKGQKLFFTYRDSGYLVLDPVTDSISWEVWDNSGKHALYHGVREGNTVRGERMRKKDLYEVYIEQVTMDSIDFKLILTQPDGDIYEKAIFNLWRVTE